MPYTGKSSMHRATTTSLGTITTQLVACLRYLTINLILILFLNSLPYTTSKEEKEQQQKSLVCWGLSSSCCNLAKLLLTDSQLQLTDAERTPFAESANTPKREEWKAKDVGSLTPSQGEVARRLLMKVQEGNVCRVCMDELISSVFCPCGHRVSCYGCAKRVVRCPLCRAPVGYVQYIHGSKS